MSERDRSGAWSRREPVNGLDPDGILRIGLAAYVIVLGVLATFSPRGRDA